MHMLTIVFGPTPTPWCFLFKDPKLADQAFFNVEAAKHGKAQFVAIFDDFDQRATLDVSGIHGFMLEDLEQSKMAQIERGLHQARTQAKAQQMAQADPALRTAAMTQGPAMLSPMGNGRAFS